MTDSLWGWYWVPTDERHKISKAVLIPISAATLITLFYFLWNLKKLKKLIPPLPPGPRGLPVIGYLPFLGTFLHKKFTELAQVYGPIYKLWLGNKLHVVISSPSLAKEVFRDKDKIFANRDPPMAAKAITYGGNDIAWSKYGPEWSKLRKVFVREMLSNSNIEACYPMRKHEVEKGIRDVFKKAENNLSIDFGELGFEIAANSVIRMFCGGRSTGFLSESRKLAGEFMVLIGRPNVSDLFPILARFDLQEDKSKMRTKDFLQMLLDFNKNGDSETSVTTDQLKAMIFDIMIGGTDTSSTMLEWAMADIMLHEEVMKKVYQELNEVVGINNIVEDSHLPKLKYLDAVLKETLRLHPALPLLVPHVSSQSTTLGGYTIPKGTAVLVNVYAIHRDPLSWDNPMEFIPERFSISESSKFDYSGNNFHYLPFGSGRRVCAGIPLAERMVLYILASFLHSFEWKLPQGTELELSDKFGIIIKKMKPLILVPKPRLSNVDLY